MVGIFNIEERALASNLDQKSFQFNHTLSQDDLFSLDSLKILLKELPLHQVSYASDSQNLKADFEAILRDKTKELNFEKIIPELMTSKSYIAASEIEKHPMFNGLCEKIVTEVKEIYKKGNKAGKIKGATFWLFIASPNTVTPFHFDRFSNFIMQIRGQKELAVFPNFNDEIIHHTQCEQYCDGVLVKTPWKEEVDHMAMKYNFSPGQVVHIPFTAAHYVKNGSEDISITISIFFHSRQSLIWSRAHRFNNHLRGLMQKIGVSLRPVGRSQKMDTFKSYMIPMTRYLKG